MSEKEVPSNDELRDDTNIESQEDHVEESSVDTENQEATIDPILKLEEEVKDLKDQNLRLYAEFENFRRRSAKERLELMESANKDTLAALLTILDDFDRALKNTQESEENIAVLAGMKLIQHKLTDTLKNKGLIAMESSVGKAFNVEEMEAITQIPAPTPDMAGKVIDEVEKGYKIGEKVLRYSKVVVGKEG
ncbi:MAG: nucleotide exchange factor GrpE [Flavobacteriales bacterium]|jgi:molecular chaperone GrpE|tara:strand:- start:10640 stop:11215 length:576 start_codon:yes stop_codon:yes gene_type:complete